MHKQRYFGMFVVILLMLSLVPASHLLGPQGEEIIHEDMTRLEEFNDLYNSPNYDQIPKFWNQESITAEERLEIWENIPEEGYVEGVSGKKTVLSILQTGGAEESKKAYKNLADAFRTTSDARQSIYLEEVFNDIESEIKINQKLLKTEGLSDQARAGYEAAQKHHLDKMNERFLVHLDNKQKGLLMSEVASKGSRGQGLEPRTVTVPENLKDGEFRYGISTSDRAPYVEGQVSLPDHFSITQNEKRYIIPTDISDNVGSLDVRTLDDGSIKDISYLSRDGKNNARLDNDMYLSKHGATEGRIGGQSPNKWVLNAGALEGGERSTVITLDSKGTKENPSLVKVTHASSKSKFDGEITLDKSIKIEMWGEGHLNADPSSDEFKVTIGDRNFFPSPTGRETPEGSKYGSVEVLQENVFAVEGNIQTPQIGILMKSYDGKGLVDFGTDGSLFSRIYDGHQKNVAQRLGVENIDEKEFTILRVDKKVDETRQVTGALEGLQDKVVFSVAESANLEVTKVDGSKGSLKIAGNPRDKTYLSHSIGELGTSTSTLDRITGEQSEGSELVAQTWKSRSTEGNYAKKGDDKVQVENFAMGKNGDPFTETEKTPGEGLKPRPRISDGSEKAVISKPVQANMPEVEKSDLEANYPQAKSPEELFKVETPKGTTSNIRDGRNIAETPSTTTPSTTTGNTNTGLTFLSKQVPGITKFSNQAGHQEKGFTVYQAPNEKFYTINNDNGNVYESQTKITYTYEKRRTCSTRSCSTQTVKIPEETHIGWKPLN